MTSLKLQLNKLSDPHTQWQLTDSENRKKSSFLYDPKVASTLDRETIYCLGTNGFEELCLLDSGFEEFERVLFSDTSLTFERSIQTKEVNDSLNLTIRRFLIRLSPYFLLSPAHKALEWLVHRFFIHFYNVDDLIRCVLPYHEHNYFTRAIQMFRLNEKNNNWGWLESAQKAGTTIPGLVMANRCATDLGFLNFICESTAMAVKEFGSNHSSLRVIINFYLKTLCSTILHSLSHKKNKKKKKNSNEENFIAHLMPFLLKGLKSKSTDYKRATYLVLSHLSNIFTFQTNIKDEILNVLSKGFSDDIIQENLLITSVFLNNQHHPSLPDRCFLKLCQMSNIVDEIFQLTNDVRIDNFLCGWFEQLLNHVIKDNNQMETDNEHDFSNLIEKTLNTIKFNSNILKFIINCFIKQFNNNNNTYIVSLASIIERKYPIDFDDNIRQQTENCSNNEERKHIREFASMTAIGFKHQPLSDRGSLAICLNHPQAQLRIEALQRIREGIKSKQNIEHEFLLDVLQSRLNDNDVKVAQEAIYLLEELHLIDNQQINDILQKILQRENEDWSPVQQSIVRLLSHDSISENKYLHLLFPTTSSELSLLNHLLDNSKQHKQSLSSLLKLTKKVFKSTTIKTLSSTLDTFIQSITTNDDQKNVLLPLLQQHDEILRLVEHHRPNWIKFSIIYILLGIETVKQQNNNEYVELAIIMIFKLLKKLSKEISPTNDEPSDITDNKSLIESHVIKKHPFTSTSYTMLWKAFIDALPKDSNQSTFWNDFLSECIQWLCSEEKIPFLHLLFNQQFPLANKLIQFLAENYLNFTDKFREQEVILKYLLKQTSTTEYTNLSILIFSFFLHSTYRPIRSTIIKLFQTKLKCTTNDFDLFIQTVKHHENEITTDSEYVCYLISQLIQTIKLNEKKKRKLNLDNSSLIHLFKTTIDQNEELNKKIQLQLNIHLLYLLKQCKHWSILNEYRTDFENLLQQSEQNLAIQENKIFIENIIQHIDHETLIHEQSFCFEIILQILSRSIKKSKAITTIDIMILTLKQLTPEMFAALSSDFDKQFQLVSECFSLWQRSKSSQLTTTIKTTLSKFAFDAKHFLTYWKTILEPASQQTNTDSQQNRLSNKKLIISKPTEQTTAVNTTINWKNLLPSLELLHNDQLLINHRHELIRPLFLILEKSLNQTIDFEQKTYIDQLCTTALLNLYTQLKPAECNPDIFNSEIVMECMKRTNDLHTTQQCLMLLSKGAQLFPEKLISMIMAMFAFVGDRLVRKDDLYSYQVMEKTIKTVIPSLYKEKNIEQRRPILAKITHVFVTSLAHLPAHRRQDIFRMLMESIGQDECLWFAPVQLFDSILLSPINRKNEETLKKSLIDGSEQMLSSFNQFSSATILISLTRILNTVLNLPDQITKNQSTPPTYSHLIDLRSYTTKHIHVLKYQLLAFVNNILSADFFMKMIKTGLHQENEINYLNELIQTILHCLLWANKLSEDDIDISRYNKSILNKIYECLNKSIALLHGSMFVNIISNLLQQQQTNEKLQRKTLEILNIRLKDEFTPENEIVLFLPHMDNILSIVSKNSTNEQEQTAQTALFTVKLLAKRLGEKHPTEFSSVSLFKNSFIEVSS
ncbi:unnamed protein product [Adineta steineri]|uniref:HEAT repeat-containing protein 1 n=2 Tax=Adineta steineri TaxID=433720 RepID=A0A814KIH0_9BILA|nr:unnamed protein product [Adineta steineri]CAF1052355.1 unnamed protein product [Adineta steineri]